MVKTYVCRFCESEISQNASTIEKIIEKAIEEHEKEHVSYYHNEPYHPTEFWNLCAKDISLRVSKEASLRMLDEIKEAVKRFESKENLLEFIELRRREI